jgi:hypothetical protein
VTFERIIMRIQRTTWTVLALVAIAPGLSRAQLPDSSSQQQVYETRRTQLVQELEETQGRLGDLRSQRARLEAQIENALAQAMQRRTQQLLMSNEQNALLQLDALLVATQDNMLAQRDRMTMLGEAVRRRTGAVLVVLFRADSVPLSSAAKRVELLVDDVAAGEREYSAAGTLALQTGAIDRLYRSEVLPVTHSVRLRAMLGSTQLEQTVSVDAPSETVTYVQFELRGGRLVPSTWTSHETAPF